MDNSPIEELERLWANLNTTGAGDDHGAYMKAYAAFERSLHAHAGWLIDAAKERDTLRADTARKGGCEQHPSDDELPSLLDMCGSLEDTEGDSVSIIRAMRDEW